jgi:hypothetical protein
MTRFWPLRYALSTARTPYAGACAARAGTSPDAYTRAMTLLAVLLALSPASPPPAATRTVYRCVRGGSVSLATAPEPGSRCRAITYDANSPKLPDLWGLPGAQRGVLYERQQDGRTVYSTRELPGSTRVLAFSVPAPPGSPAHAGLADPGPPRRDVFVPEFRAAAKLTGVDEAWLRAIAHVESGYDPAAVSPKGAQGLMQLMPETAAAYDVTDPFNPNQSIQAGARHLADLMRLYPGDLERVAAAYNAGVAAVRAHGGIPPYAETRSYVAKVMALHARYRAGRARAR